MAKLTFEQILAMASDIKSEINRRAADGNAGSISKWLKITSPQAQQICDVASKIRFG